MLVAGPLGPSGVESFARGLTIHSDVDVPEWATPAAATILAEALVKLDSDSVGWLPRSAGEAARHLAELAARAGFGSAWDNATEELLLPSVYIPVYGHLPVPVEADAKAWGRATRRAIVGRHAGPTILRVGAQLRAVHLDLLHGDDALVVVTRHPADLLRGLTESVVDGMRMVEAVWSIDAHYRNLESIAMAANRVIIVRFEEMADIQRQHPSTWSYCARSWSGFQQTERCVTRNAMRSVPDALRRQVHSIASWIGYA